jgi:hypothetical protein
MNLSLLLPPSDLLDKVRGVEAGLRQRKKISSAGAVLSLLISTLYLLAALEKDVGSFADLLLRTVRDPVLLVLGAGLFLALLMTWSRFWLRTSRQPFRYTCSIGNFDPIESGNARKDVQSWMSWMPYDMTRLLNERVQRFFFADGSAKPGEENAVPEQNSSGTEAYIHVRAHWVVRKRPRSRAGAVDAYEIEVMPRVRLGPPNTPEVLAQSTVLLMPGRGDRAAYEELLEQVYHSIVTEVYRQLSSDVRRKIDLLPTTRHRAIALLYEADDYARSNTLHAYQEAAELYRETVALCDPHWRPAVLTPVARRLRAFRCAIHRARAGLRRLEARFRPSVDELNLLAARAMTGYARMTVFTRVLRLLSGHNAGMATVAAPVVRDAITRIRTLSPDVRGRADALFEAQLNLALAEWCRSDYRVADAELQRARALAPDKADEDAIFILASGLVSQDRRTRLGLFRKAVERAPRSEVAQFCLADEAELLWRSRDRLEKSVAETVLAEYDRLLKLNPGNVGGCANAGYVCWLLDEPTRARELFEQGRRFKTTRQALHVSELEYGLARIEAEQGDLDAAYRHYVAAVPALSLGLEGDFRSYFHRLPSVAVERRFRQYYLRVRDRLRKLSATDPARARIARSLHAFALYDVGEAYVYGAGLFWNFDSRRHALGVKRLRSACRINRDFLLPYWSLADVLPSNDECREVITTGLGIEPAWPAGKLMLAHSYATGIPDIPRLKAHLEQLQRERDAMAKEPPSYDLKARLDERNELIKTTEDALAKAPQLRNERRRQALLLVRELLPHKWMWNQNELDLDTLRRDTFDREYRWERELTVMHVKALYVWARCFLSDETRATDAIRVLEHIRERFWPTDDGILGDIVQGKLALARANAERCAAIVREALRENPAVALTLVDRNVPLTRQQLFAADLEACRWNSDYRDARIMREQRARAHELVAQRCAGTDDAEALYRRAAELTRSGWAFAALARDLGERAVTAGDAAASLREKAAAAAESAANLEPKNRSYRQDLAAVRWTQRFGSAAATFITAPQQLMIHIAPALVPLLDELFAETITVRRNVFGSKYPPIFVSDPLTDARAFRILAGGTTVVDCHVAESDSILASIAQNLEIVLRTHIQEFLKLDDVLALLNLEEADAGDRIRAEGRLPELACVLRALAAEQISLHPFMPIVRAFRLAYDPACSLTAVVEQVRSHPAVHGRIEALHAAAGVAMVRAGTAFEAVVRQAVNVARGAVSAIDPQITEGLRKSVAASFAADGAAVSHRLLVCTPELRPWVMKIVEGSVERLIVASERQIAPAVLRKVTRTASYVEPAREEGP